MQDDEKLEALSIELLCYIYKATPVEVLNKWGIKRYSRFKTKLWKHLEESSDIKSLINNYFVFYQNSLSALIRFYDETIKGVENDIYNHISENLAILVSRMQFDLSQKGDETDATG